MESEEVPEAKAEEEPEPKMESEEVPEAKSEEEFKPELEAEEISEAKSEEDSEPEPEPEKITPEAKAERKSESESKQEETFDEYWSGIFKCMPKIISTDKYRIENVSKKEQQFLAINKSNPGNNGRYQPCSRSKLHYPFRTNLYKSASNKSRKKHGIIRKNEITAVV